tara:strand:+ start:1347 stop:1799 length:453 start_codon:yes stop_codon:yes gene_type:complete
VLRFSGPPPVIGVVFGEAGNPVMLIPYAILMFIYAQFYKRFSWWKVALTSYLGGIIVENVINRSPIQIPTLMWIAFFTYPYFLTKIWENRHKVSLFGILKDFKFSFVFSVVLGLLSWYISKDNVSPPLIVLGLTLPFVVSVVWKFFKKRK